MRLGVIGSRRLMYDKPFWGLTFKARNKNVIVNMRKSGSPDSISLEYCMGNDDWTDDSNWKSFDADNGTTPITLENSGDMVYFRAGSSGNTALSTDYVNCRRFTLSKSCSASGNIMSLLTRNEADWQSVQMADDCYANMFNGCTSLTSAPALPATTLADYCYYNMFQGCTSLTSAPELPATTLAVYCYYHMFQGCTSLTSAPELPATTLASNCYNYMFYGCTSLTSAPELPATTLASRCYYGMFYDCTSLTSAPELPAITLASSCYTHMFSGCASLSSVDVDFTSWSPTNATTNWLNNVAPSGTFTCPSELDTTTRDASHVPVNWKVNTKGDFWGLTFTAVEPNVTVNMTKNGSTDAVSLEYCPGSADYTDDNNWNAFDADNGTTPITLTNTGDKVYFRAGSTGNTKISKNNINYRRFTLNGSAGASGNIMSLLTQNESDWQSVQMGSYCYSSMFNGCASLTSAPELPATTLAEGCYLSMFCGCTSLTSAPELPATTLAEGCYYGMFLDCTSLSSAPELPATTLVEDCYAGMFLDCTSLSSAPELPATTLVEDCYADMFDDCTSLSSIEVAFTDWNTSGNSTVDWLYNVAPSGTFTCPSALGTNSTITRGTSNCPTGWTVVNT